MGEEKLEQRHKILYMRPQGLTQNAQTESIFFTQSSQCSVKFSSLLILQRGVFPHCCPVRTVGDINI